MTFDPKKFGLSEDAGPNPSRTVFYKQQGLLTVSSNGIPYPALSDSSNVEEQEYNFNFNYRAGSNTQNPHTVNDSQLGIFANGVTFTRPTPSFRIPYTNIKAPPRFTFNSVQLGNLYGADLADATVTNGVYNYKTGKFLTSAWNIPAVENNTSYFNSSNFEGDNLRHEDGHSKIVGFAFDGYPIYGPHGYLFPTDANSGIKRIQSGFIKLPTDVHRPSNWKYTDSIETPEGTIELSAGSFIEDFVYRKARGDLDENNGRYCVTPDFPNGTYAYFLTFEDDDLTTPAYPYIVGNSTKQKRTLIDIDPEIPEVVTDLWNISSGARISTLIERNVVEINLPLANLPGITLEIISGEIPTGTRLENNKIVGTVYEVAYNRTFVCVVRAYYNDLFQDRTLEIAVTGPDDPVWQTNEGLLPVGANDNLYILDNELIDFQLIATDDDLPAGDELSYFIADGDGVLPPGISLTEDGRLYGIVEPLLSLDKRFQGGGFDSSPFGSLPADYGVLSSNGYSSFYYDTQGYDYNEPTANVRKLNRYYPFAITVTDGNNFVRREFRIYLVGDDYLKADNTIMKSGSGVFKADATNVRTPTWITPSDLGFKRANNYVTIFLDVIDDPTLEGVLTYTLESVNNDGSKSELPPGLTLDSRNGELVGNIPYQPAITTDYKFSVRATRITTDLDTVEIFANFYEDTLIGKNSFKIFKIDLTGNIDGVQDLFDLIGRDILLENRLYKVTNVDSRNADYDIIFLDQNLAPSINLLLSQTAKVGQDHIFVSRLGEQAKEKYNKRTLRFAENETYSIDNIIPYIEYEVTQSDPSSDELYPSDSPRDIEVSQNYFIGDYVVYTPETGGNGFIYKCIVTHNTVPILDDEDNIVFDDDGNIQIDFQTENWQQVAETLSELSLEDRLEATKQSLEASYGHTAYINVIEKGRWKIKIPSTSTSRIITNIKEFFLNSGDSGEIRVSLVRDNEDRIQFDKNLSRQLNQGRNIGIALFAKDSFSENLVVAASDVIDIPSTVKTFDLKVIGEIDTNIEWITPSYLGEINANFTSTFKLVAETTVPDTKMIYTLIDGRLPFGMHLRYDGEIIGSARQFNNDEGLGLTTFDNRTMTWDGSLPGDTTFDREYRFTVEARDRFKYTAIEREFKILVRDLDDTEYTDIYMRPMLNEDQREIVRNFVSNPDIFDPSKMYRLGDPSFGVQRKFDMLVYAGIEAKDIRDFVSASAKNHKRKQYRLGDFKSAIANDPITHEPLYEVVYIDVIDPAMSNKGKTSSRFKIDTQNKITVDSIQYAGVDDETKTGLGYESLAVYGRGGYVRFVVAENERILIETRDGEFNLDTDNNDFELELFDTSDISVKLELGDSEPQRIRPTPTNTIKTDTTAIKVSQGQDNIRYRSSIEHMRDNIENIGKKERNYLPLWMRTPQNGLQELDYVTAIPVCYCLPGESKNIIRNIQDSGFNQKLINYDIDRYIVKRTANSQQEQFILFANYQFNA